MSFPNIVNQMGPFDRKRKNSVFRFCRPILDIFRFTLLSNDDAAHRERRRRNKQLSRSVQCANSSKNLFDQKMQRQRSIPNGNTKKWARVVRGHWTRRGHFTFLFCRARQRTNIYNARAQLLFC